jgi:hypothetical protein
MLERVGLIGGFGIAAALLGVDGLFSEAEAALPNPESLDVSFDSLELLIAQVHSPYVTAETLFRLQPIIAYRIADLDALIAAMEQVAPSDAKELIALREARAELAIIDSRVDALVERLRAFDSGVERGDVSGYRVNQTAARGAKLIPNFDVAALEKLHSHTVSMYNGVTYGEVLVLDDHGNLVERKLSDLIRIGKTSDKISPALAHQLMEVFGRTDSGCDGWTMSSGAFEKETAHKDGSDHIAKPHALDTVDIIPNGNRGVDPKRLGEFALAARGDESVRFFQIETGPKMTVVELQGELRAEWAGKISDNDLSYMLSKVESNGSGVHIHIEFNCATHHTAYVPPATTVASR